MWCDWNTMGLSAWTMMIFFWGGILALIVGAIRSFDRARARADSDAGAILERRFASGDIAVDEYEERRRLLVARRRSHR